MLFKNKEGNAYLQAHTKARADELKRMGFVEVKEEKSKKDGTDKKSAPKKDGTDKK